jgi:DNA-binding transcriptional LysR family regulator
VVVSEGRSVEFNEQILPSHTRSVVSVVDDVDAGVRLVRRGPSIILITEVTSYFADPTLLWRPLAGAPPVTVRMLHHRSRPLSEAAQAAMDLAMMWAEHYRSAFTRDPLTERFTVDETVVEAARDRFERAVGQVLPVDEPV